MHLPYLDYYSSFLQRLHSLVLRFGMTTADHMDLSSLASLQKLHELEREAVRASDTPVTVSGRS